MITIPDIDMSDIAAAMGIPTWEELLDRAMRAEHADSITPNVRRFMNAMMGSVMESHGCELTYEPGDSWVVTVSTDGYLGEPAVMVSAYCDWAEWMEGRSSTPHGYGGNR